MQVKEKTKQQIEARFSQMGDYVKMDYLSSCLRQPIDFDTKKFVLVKLSGLYETRRMFPDAGRAMRTAAEINTIFQQKINDFMKSAELFIKGGNYDEAEVSMKKAFSIADKNQKAEIKKAVKEFYRTQAKLFISQNKRKHAIMIYEKLLTLNLDDGEKQEAKEQLLELYNNLGKIREYYSLKGRR